MCWVSKLSFTIDGQIISGALTLILYLKRAGNIVQQVSILYPGNFIQNSDFNSEAGYTLNPTPSVIFQPTDMLSIDVLCNSNLPEGTTFVIEAELAY
jgi:hypothetical protein